MEKLKQYLGGKIDKIQGWTKYCGERERQDAKHDLAVSPLCKQMSGGPLSTCYRAQEEDEVDTEEQEFGLWLEFETPKLEFSRAA